MDFLTALFFLLVAIVVVGGVVSVLARRHVFIPTSLSPVQAAATCDGKFSGLAWRGVEGRGTLNYQARGIAYKGGTPPVLSIDVGTDDSGATVVELWMSAWTHRYGMVNHVEKVFWKRWTIPKALREAAAPTVDPPATSGRVVNPAGPPPVATPQPSAASFGAAA